MEILLQMALLALLSSSNVDIRRQYISNLDEP